MLALLIRLLALPIESVTHGPLYAALRYLIRSPVALDPDQTWRDANEVGRPFFSFLRGDIRRSSSVSCMFALNAGSIIDLL